MCLRQEIWNVVEPEGLEFQAREKSERSETRLINRQIVARYSKRFPRWRLRPGAKLFSFSLAGWLLLPRARSDERLIESNRTEPNRGYDTRTVPQEAGKHAASGSIRIDRNVANYWIPRDRVVDRDARESRRSSSLRENWPKLHFVDRLWYFTVLLLSLLAEAIVYDSFSNRVSHFEGWSRGS